MIAVIHKISGAGGKPTLSPEESLCRSVSFGKLRSHNRSHANTRAITATRTIKNAYSNASVSSVTAATKSYSATTASKWPKKHFESSNILELGYRAACEQEGRWGCPKTLCACFAL